ncbi:lactonase family protein [Salinigranum salinum]|uniref:lactonase family protein n=1 Tax=Salinigranum salinum TaxID=1364937 RepID=UPI001260F40B|nr:lactonase family protein [Salinigranum salinum]
MDPQTAFVGTYSDGASEGIYTCEISVGTEPALRSRGVTEVTDNPSFVTIHPTQQFLYTVHEIETGAVTGFAIDENDELTRLNRVESGASGPCHCQVHPSGRFLFVAHYTGGAASVVPIREDGRLDTPTDVVHHEGSSVHPERQTAPHPHAVESGPDGKYVYVPDLGTDEIVRYEFDPTAGRLQRVGAVSAAAGAGPRHLAFHPDAPFVYVINELDSTMTAYTRAPETGELDEITTEPTLPTDYGGENITADVHVHPSGRWVYGSNRGHDSIVIFEVDSRTGGISPIGHEPTGGEWPRNFAIDLTGSLLLAENRYTDDIFAFEIDDESGELTETSATLSIPSPACMQIRRESP